MRAVRLLSIFGFSGAAILAVGWLPASSVPALASGAADWAMNVTVIEGCSCPMFCQCYFNTKPAGHATDGHRNHKAHGGHGHHAGGEGAKHFCRFNNAYRVNRGHYGAVKLDGVRFWLTGDIGDDFGDGRLDWGELILDTAATKAQRDAVAVLAGNAGPLFPLSFDSYRISERSIDTWRYDQDTAVATIDGGRTAEVRLRRFAGMTDEPVVIHNLKYWGAPRNDGFLMMPNEVEAFRVGDDAFEYRGTNGFMVTFDINSQDVAARAQAAK